MPPRRSRSCCHHQVGVSISETSAIHVAFDLHVDMGSEHICCKVTTGGSWLVQDLCHRSQGVLARQPGETDPSMQLRRDTRFRHFRALVPMILQAGRA